MFQISQFRFNYQKKKKKKNYLLPVRLKLVPKLKMLRIHFKCTLFYKHDFFLLTSVWLEKSLFHPKNMLRICLHIEKEPLTASCIKPLLFMSMEANVAACRFLMSSLAKSI